MFVFVMKAYKTLLLSYYRKVLMSSLYSPKTSYVPPPPSMPAFQYQPNADASQPNQIVYISPQPTNDAIPEVIQYGVVYTSDVGQYYPVQTQQPIQQFVEYSVPLTEQSRDLQSRDLSQIVTTINTLTDERLTQLKAKIDELEEKLTQQVEAKIRRCCLLF